MSKSAKKAPITELKKESFFRYLRRKDQRYLLLAVFAFYLITYFVLTSLWPSPNGLTDSGGYVNAALKNKYDGYRPFGYSSFLISLHNVSYSIYFVVFAQYWISAFASTFFVFTFKYFFRPKTRLAEILFMVFSLVSIVVIYLTDAIISDSIFASLTVLWVTFGLWFMWAESIGAKALNFFFHLFVMGLLINIRYTGFFYVSVTFILIAMAFFRKNRLVGVGLALLLVMLSYKFYTNQVQVTAKHTTIESFGGFSGWQRANNALFVWPHIKIDEAEIEDPKVKDMVHFLHNYDTMIVRLTAKGINPDMMWTPKGPLKSYMADYRKKNPCFIVYAWTLLGSTTYHDFASYISGNYPVEYFKYFLWPNFLGTIYPKNDLVYTRFKPNAIPGVLMKNWFRMDEKTVFDPGSNAIRNIAPYIPMYRLVLWLLVFAAILFYLFRRKRTGWDGQQINSYWFMALFVMGYLAFHVLTVPFELRYIAPVHCVQIAILYLFVNTFFLKEKTTTEPVKAK